MQLAKAKQEAAAYKAKIKQQNAEIQKLASPESRQEGGGGSEKAGGRGAEKRSRIPRVRSEFFQRNRHCFIGRSQNRTSKDWRRSGSDIAQYACQFVGNPYVPGGTSLTNRADCSGFTQSVYRVYGYSIPGIHRPKRSAGREVSYEEAQPGDLICYAGHVAIYLGNGRIVHASSVKTGIKYGNATYKPILSVRRIVN